jgi:hypothetical protein
MDGMPDGVIDPLRLWPRKNLVDAVLATRMVECRGGGGSHLVGLE